MLPTFVQRSAAVAILICVLSAFWLAVVAPIAGAFNSQTDDILRAQEALARYRAMAGTQSELEAQLSAAGRGDSDMVQALKGTNPQLVAADLQNKVKGIVEGAGGTLRSIQNLPVQDENGFRRIGLGVVLAGQHDALRAILHALESGQPYLFLDNVSIRASGPIGLMIGNTQLAPNLEVHFDVIGYMAPEEK